MRELVVAVRTIRAEMQVPAKEPVRCIVNTKDSKLAGFLRQNTGLVQQLVLISGLEFSAERPSKSSLAVIPGCEVYVPLDGVVDFEREFGRIEKEATRLRQAVAQIDTKFANPSFAERAKPEVVESEKERRQELAGKLARLEAQVEALRT